jgi:hypothetical protein
MPKVAGTSRQRYPEWRAASKVLSNSRPKMTLYGYSMSTTSKVMYSVRLLYGVPNKMGKGYNSNGLDSLSSEAVKGLHWLFELFLVIAHFFKGR